MYVDLFERQYKLKTHSIGASQGSSLDLYIYIHNYEL